MFVYVVTSNACAWFIEKNADYISSKPERISWLIQCEAAAHEPQENVHQL